MTSFFSSDTFLLSDHLPGESTSPPQHDATDPSLTRTSENAYLLGIG
jgi:hypothetical protein